MKKVKWQDNPSFIRKLQEAMNRGAVILPYRNTEILISPVKENLPLPYRLVFCLEKIREEIKNNSPAVNLILTERILERIFPTSLLFHISDKEYLTLVSEPILNKIFPNDAEIYFSEWEEDEGPSVQEITLKVEREIKIRRPFTILDIRQLPFLLEKKGEVGIYDIEEAIGTGAAKGLAKPEVPAGYEKIKISSNLFFSVLFVCTGNTCRSPMAKGILEKMLKDSRVFIYSGGTNGLRNSSASDNAIRVVARFGGDISRHLSQPLTLEMIESADLILVMERRHMLKVLEMVPEAKNKVFMLSSYPEREGKDIIDPIGLPEETFLEIGKEMKIYLEKVAKDIRERLL